MRCPFCQNSDISMADAHMETVDVSPEALIEKATALLPRGNIGIAYTYNEPLVGYEYVLDCAMLAKQTGLMNVVVTNGLICETPLLSLLPYIDAMNIDLKGFTSSLYQKLGGDLETVKNTIRLAAEACHIEVTTLVVPGFNDSLEEMQHEAEWLASISADIPLHITRFFPRYLMATAQPTPIATMVELQAIAVRYLHDVLLGNC